MFLKLLINLTLVVLLGQFNIDYGRPLDDFTSTDVLLPVSLEAGPQLASTAEMPPAITARSAVVVDETTGSFLFNKEGETRTQLASLTKLMTVLVFLDMGTPWDRIVKMDRKDEREGAVLFISRGEEVEVRDLFYSALVGSANNAAMALARSTGLSGEEFVRKMNQKARELSLYNTSFVEPTGLDWRNVSTANDIARLARQAFLWPEVREAAVSPEYIFQTARTKIRHRIQSTNELITKNDIAYNLIGGKTGYTNEAGFCLTIEAENNGRKVIAVVLGSEDNEARFNDADQLIKWVFKNYQWP